MVCNVISILHFLGSSCIRARGGLNPADQYCGRSACCFVHHTAVALAPKPIWCQRFSHCRFGMTLVDVEHMTLYVLRDEVI